jgi:hypothetical protein
VAKKIADRLRFFLVLLRRVYIRIDPDAAGDDFTICVKDAIVAGNRCNPVAGYFVFIFVPVP